MKLTVQRNQESNRKDVKFSVHFHLALLPEEQELVGRYNLHKFNVGAGFTLQDLQRGARKEAVVMDHRLINAWTSAVAHVNDVVEAEANVKKGCRELLVAFNNLKTFSGTHEFIYEKTDDTEEAPVS